MAEVKQSPVGAVSTNAGSHGSDHDSVTTATHPEMVADDDEKQTPVALPTAPQGPPPPPDGGLVAWLQVAAGVAVFMCSWGLINSFGVFQSFYATDLLLGTSNSSISWIGTLQICLVMAGAIWSGMLTDLGYGYQSVVFGVVMIVFGMFMTSLCKEYWQLVLAQGLVIGIGMGSAFAPTTGIINTYFAKRRGLALGVVSTGSNIGGIIFPIVFTRLVDRIGFGWACRVIAFIMLALLVVPVLVVRQRMKPAAVRRLYDLKALREPDFTIYAVSLFIAYMGAYVPFFYIQLYALEEGIITSNLNFYLLPILNAGGLFGRVAIGHLSDKMGAMNTYTFTCVVCAVLMFGWIGIHNEAGIIVFVLLYGFFSSGPIVLPNLVTATNLTPDMRHFGVRLTMQLIPSALGVLIGNPIAGAIQPHGWVGLILFGAVTVIAGAALSYIARCYNGGVKLIKKV